MKKNEKTDHYDRNARRAYYDDFCGTMFEPTNNKLASLHAFQLHTLECFVDDLLANDDIPFVPHLSGNGKSEYAQSPLARKYFRCVPDFIHVVSILSPRYEYSERVNVFIAVCRSMVLSSEQLEWGNHYSDPKKTFPHMGGISAAEIVNALVKAIRDEWKQKNIQAKVNARKNETNRRYVDYCRYVDALFNDCARLVVLRIDLYYQKDCSNDVKNDVKMAEITKDLNHLFENKRGNSLFSFMKGYIAKLEYGVDKGLHWHVLLLFDGSVRNNTSHSHLAEEIGEYWTHTITKGRGAYWNVNRRAAANYEKLKRLGVGPIDWYSTDLRMNLKEHVVKYLCKTDQFIRPKFGTKARLFRRGNFPTIPDKRRGKPRKDLGNHSAPNPRLVNIPAAPL